MFPKGDNYESDEGKQFHSNNDAANAENEKEFYEADLLSNNNSQIGKW